MIARPVARLIAVSVVLIAPLIAEENPPQVPVQQPQVELPRIILVGDFGDAVPENVVKVLESTAEQLLRHTPDRHLGTILVSPSLDAPISLFTKGPAGEYQIRLTARGRSWAQYAYQFAHELCHLLCNFEQRKSGDKQWFEEALCETASLFAQKQLALSWDKSPPYSNWKSYSASFTHYVNDILARRDRRLPPELSFPEWYRGQSAALKQDRTSTERSQLVVAYLLPLFEHDPAGEA